MTSRLRTALVAGSLLATGAIVGTTATTGVNPVAATEFRAAEEGRFFAISSYRTMDSRIEGGGKVVRVDDSDLGFPIPRFVQFESGGDGTSQFPDEAIAVTYNVTVTETEGLGFVQIDGFNFADGETSTVNWGAGNVTVANSGVARLTPAVGAEGALGVYLDGAPGAKAHVIIDITGYYMPAP